MNVQGSFNLFKGNLPMKFLACEISSNPIFSITPLILKSIFIFKFQYDNLGFLPLSRCKKYTFKMSYCRWRVVKFLTIENVSSLILSIDGGLNEKDVDKLQKPNRNISIGLIKTILVLMRLWNNLIWK